MAFLHRLETRLSRFAIPGLIRYIVALTALVFILGRATPGYLSVLTLDPGKILQGQVWRLVTYIFIPETNNMFFVLIALMFLWYIGDQLESTWGAFRLNLFYFTGMFFTTIAAFFFGGTGVFLTLSLFLAFATLFPDMEVLFLFILPVKVKWLAWIYVGLLVVGSISLPVGAQIGIVISLFNYFLFFGPDFIRAQMQKGKVAARRAQFEQNLLPEDEAIHRCKICGRTEISHPQLDFRVTEDGGDYCTEHLPKRS